MTWALIAIACALLAHEFTDQADRSDALVWSVLMLGSATSVIIAVLGEVDL
jgi:hypothetical protein